MGCERNLLGIGLKQCSLVRRISHLLSCRRRMIGVWFMKRRIPLATGVVAVTLTLSFMGPATEAVR